MQFGILGPVLVVEDGHVRDITVKQRVLLARLLLHANETVSVERLIDDAFGDDHLSGTDGAIRNHMSRLRKALVPEESRSDLIVRRGGGYCILIGDDDLDAWRFERLAAAGRREHIDGDAARAVGLLGRALALWRGPALADVTFADFAHREASRLAELRLCAREDHAAARLAVGAAREVVVDLEALVAENPLRERLWSLLMVALARCGRQAEALRAYQRLRHMLDHELGLTPSPEVQELEVSILRQDPGFGLELGGHPGRGRWGVERQPAHNLPVVMSRFIGREVQLGELKSHMATNAVVTICGIGGAGKTRLALEVAASIVPTPPDGVWLVDMSRLSGPHHGLEAVAAALGVREQPGVGLADAVVAALRRAKLVVVVDACEHYLALVAELVAMLVAASPGLRVLATSRAPLCLDGEVVYPVPPLTTPPYDDESTLESIAASEAVRLFVDRAEQVRPGFTLGADNAAAVAAICRRLDGMPLAIELAAARLESLEPAAIASAIDERLGVSAGLTQVTPVRHAALPTSLEWSHHLMGEAEQVVLRRLSVFEGSATLAALEALCAGACIDAPAVHAVVARLVAINLVGATTVAGEVRFGLLDEVRSFAHQRLVDARETSSVAAAHALWYLELAEAAEAHLEGPGQVAWLAHLDAEHDNLRAALAWAFDVGDVELALRLGGALTLFWHLRCAFSEGQAWLEKALAAGAAPPLLRAKALLGVGWLACMRVFDEEYAADRIDDAGRIYAAHGDGRGVARSFMWLGCSLFHTPGASAREFCDKSAAVAREVGDPWCLCMALSGAGWAEMVRGDARTAGPLFEEALAEARRSGDRLGLELSLTGLGHVAMAQGAAPVAERLLSDALVVARELGHAYVEGDVLSCLGQLAAAATDFGRADALLRESLAVSGRAGSNSLVGDCLSRLGRVAVARNDLDAATAFFGEARALAKHCGRVSGEAELGLGEVCAARGETEQARRHLEMGYSAAAALGHRKGMAEALHELGNLAFFDGDRLRALSLCSDALAHRSAVGDLGGIGRSLNVLAGLAMLDERPKEAARLAGAGRSLRGSAAQPHWWTERPLIEPVLRRAREQLSTDAFEEAWSEGAAMSADDAVRLASAIIDAMSSNSIG